MSLQLFKIQRGLLSLSHCISQTSPAEAYVCSKLWPTQRTTAGQGGEKKWLQSPRPWMGTTVSHSLLSSSPRSLQVTAQKALEPKLLDDYKETMFFRRKWVHSDLDSEKGLTALKPDKLPPRVPTHSFLLVFRNLAMTVPQWEGRNRNKRIFPSQQVCENSCVWFLVALLQAHNLKSFWWAVLRPSKQYVSKSSMKSERVAFPHICLGESTVGSPGTLRAQEWMESAEPWNQPGFQEQRGVKSTLCTGLQ